MQQLHPDNKTRSFYTGICITLIIALMGALLGKIPYLDIVGQLVLAIIIGMVWGHTIGLKNSHRSGVQFSSKKLLRIGIILLGLRLNLSDMYDAGLHAFLYAGFLLTIALVTVYSLARLFHVNKTLSILTACGTAICGAAAIVAIAPLLKAKESTTAVSVAVIAVLGTMFTLIYTLMYPFLPFTDYQYGIFSGGTLHEIAHAVAASTAGGEEAENIAIVVKLTRVALLVPVAILIGIYVKKREPQNDKQGYSLKTLPIPWFIFGFLAMSAINTIGFLPESVVNLLIAAAYLLLSMAMAGLGLNVEFSVFKKFGLHVFLAALLGTLVLIGCGFGFIYLMGLG
ncbi:YeiH family protein [Oceanobacillus kimchii]|uniref:YeiH family protein n=1 Tax=Oceanobacillus kimchii TaxID=746691 RepID=UPI00098413E7|nr:YeiH family protein [Oceanobacillus kimchii]